MTMELSSVQRVLLLSLEMPCYRRVSDRLIEVKYNEISELVNRNCDRVRKFTVIQ